MMTYAWAIDPLALLIVGYGLVRHFQKADRKWTQFHRDWNGEPERPGVQRRPGVMERLAVSENALSVVVTDVGQIKARLDKEKTQ